MTKRRAIALFLGIVLLAPIVLNMIPSVSAASNDGYASVIEDYAIDCGYSSLKESDQKKCKGLLYDLNGDGQDELIVQYLKKRSTTYSIWTMENGTPVCALDDPFCTGSDVTLCVTKHNGKTYFVLNSLSTGSDASYFEWLFYDVSTAPYQLAYNLGEAFSYDSGSSSQNLVNKTGDGSTSAQVYASAENKTEIPFESAAKTFDALLADIQQGNTVQDEHPYIPLVEEAIASQKMSYGDGYGILLDIDHNGIEELVMVFTAAYTFEAGYSFPAKVCSVYTLSEADRSVICLLDQEFLFTEAGGPSGSACVVAEGTDLFLGLTAETGETGGDYTNRYGFWKLYHISGSTIETHMDAEYDYYYDYSKDTVDYKKSSATIQGSKCSYQEFESWVDSLKILEKVDAYYWNDERSCLTLKELLSHLRTMPAIKDTNVLCAYAADVDLTVSLGEEMKVSYALFVNGEHTKTWNKPALAITNDDIISVTQCQKSDIGYTVTIKGERAGATYLTVTDGDSGASVTIYVTVRDTYATPISYIMDDVPNFDVPTSSVLIPWSDDIQTNIYDCYGLYVNDFPDADEIQKVDGDYLLEFNVYNEKSMYGSIDVYDKYNNWLRSYPIEKYTGVQSIYDTLEGIQYLVKDFANGDLLNYISDSQSAYTRAKVRVPEGGYFTISNNYLQSPGAYLYNSIDIVFTGANLTGDMMTFFDEIVNQITGNASFRDKFIKILTEDFGSVALELSMEVAIGDYGTVARLCSDSFLEIMDDSPIDFWGLAEVCFGVAEDVLKELLPTFLEHSLETVFTIQKLTDAVCQLDDIKDSPNQPYIIMYTPEAGKGITTMNGVTVIPSEGAFAENAVLQVFRISDSGNIVASDSGFAVDQYALYHICYTVDNSKVQPNGNVTIKIPIPATFNKDACDVYHQQPDGSWEIVNTRIEGEYIVFEVDHFSLFAVVNGSEDNGITQNDVSEETNPENSDGVGIPKGMIGVIAAVILITVAAVIILVKRK